LLRNKRSTGRAHRPRQRYGRCGRVAQAAHRVIGGAAGSCASCLFRIVCREKRAGGTDCPRPLPPFPASPGQPRTSFEVDNQPHNQGPNLMIMLLRPRHLRPNRAGARTPRLTKLPVSRLLDHP
jgi:hypothetical protein